MDFWRGMVAPGLEGLGYPGGSTELPVFQGLIMTPWAGGGGGGWGAGGGCSLLFNVLFGSATTEIKENCYISNVRKNYWKWKEGEKERNLLALINYMW